jgi:hypothetical protein
VGYFAVGVLIGVTAGLGNALVAVNLNFAQGTLGLYSNEAAWLTAAYLMTNTTANLLLVKFRQQFGLQSFVRYMLAPMRWRRCCTCSSTASGRRCWCARPAAWRRRRSRR